MSFWKPSSLDDRDNVDDDGSLRLFGDREDYNSDWHSLQIARSNMKKKKEKKTRKPSMQDMIMAKMGNMVFVKPTMTWLDTGSPNHNKVLGSKRFGAPAGKIYEFRGKKHAGKTAEVMRLAGLAQRQHNAFVIWIDAENSLSNESTTPEKEFYNSWATKLGLDTSSDKFYRIGPKVLISKKQRKRGKKVTKAGTRFLQSAESMFAEAEAAMEVQKDLDKNRTMVIALDSIANLSTEKQVDAGPTGKNMNSQLDRAAFLSDNLPRISAFASNYTVWVFLINQIRTNPTILFGNKEYSPGGKGVEHNAHIQIDMRPFKGGVVFDGEDVVGIRGKMVNVKNKAGGGSIQSQLCTYQVTFNKHFKKMWRFGPLARKIKKDTV